MENNLGIDRPLGRGRLLAVLILAVFGCSDSNDSNGPVDTGVSDSMEMGEDLGPDAGVAERDTGRPDARTDADVEPGFQVGMFDPDWSAEEATRMFWGLADEACLRFRPTGGSGSARADVQLVEGFSTDTWNWRFGREGEGFVAWEDRFEVDGRELRLAGRLQQDAALEQDTTYGGVNSSPPVAAALNEDDDLTDLNFESQDVEAFRFSQPPGVGSSIDPQDHAFSFTGVSVEVVGETFSGFQVDHRVDGAQVASYRLVPAFGIVGFELEGTEYELCDFRICTSTGCEGRDGCDMLNCED